MAEGFARQRYPDLMIASSAGVMPANIVQPETMQVMAEAGISLEGHQPKPIRDVDWKSADVVVNMSGAGILQLLPAYEGGNLIWPVPDPMARSLRKYRKVRDQIEALVDNLAMSLRRQLAD
jgi:protein-tyrosine-phosphatase